MAAKYRDYFNHYYRVGIQYQYPLLLRLGESFRMDKEKEDMAGGIFDGCMAESVGYESGFESLFPEDSKKPRRCKAGHMQVSK